MAKGMLRWSQVFFKALRGHQSPIPKKGRSIKVYKFKHCDLMSVGLFSDLRSRAGISEFPQAKNSKWTFMSDYIPWYSPLTLPQGRETRVPFYVHVTCISIVGCILYERNSSAYTDRISLCSIHSNGFPRSPFFPMGWSKGANPSGSRT